MSAAQRKRTKISESAIQVEGPYVDAPIMVASKEWHGEMRIDIRHYFTPEGGDSPAPTKKGVNLPVEYMRQVYEALGEILNQLEDNDA